jgi:hypothetical protein
LEPSFEIGSNRLVGDTCLPFSCPLRATKDCNWLQSRANPTRRNMLSTNGKWDCMESQQTGACRRKTSEIWFGTRRSVVRIHSPRPNPGSAREFGKAANWRALERFALPGIPSGRIRSLAGRTSTAHYRDARSLDTMSKSIVGIVWGADRDRNSLLERDFGTVLPSRIAGFDQAPSIRLLSRVERAQRSAARVSNRGARRPGRKPGDHGRRRC